MAFEFKFPDVGEGIVEGELLAWKVKEGDIVEENQTLAEVETDKAVVELPSPRAGRISKLIGAEGDVIAVGSVVAVIEEAGGSGASGVAASPAPAPAAATPTPTAPAAPAAPVTAAAPPESPAAEAPTAQPDAAESAPEEAPYTGSVVGRLEEAPEEEETPVSAGPARAAGAASKSRSETPAPEMAAAVTGEPPAVEGAEAGVLAMPSVRALAKELGVDLARIRGTGSGGRVLAQDVEDAAEAEAYGGGHPLVVPSQATAEAVAAAPPALGSGGAPSAGGPETQASTPAVSARPAGEGQPLMGGALEDDGLGIVERIPLRGVRRTMAKRMAESLAKQAQVTTMDEADVTVVRRIREKERTVATERGVRLTYLAFVVKACTSALKRFPRLNATLEESREEFLLKHYYNIGIAVDTKAGLVVPNIKAADTKSIFRIAEEIVELVDKAQDRQLELADFHGGTFTITNYGTIGSTFATPVINYPEVAILGMGRVRELPVVREGQIAIRHILPLSLTIDHQLVDGAEAARFLNLVISYLEDPDLLLLEGD